MTSGEALTGVDARHHLDGDVRSHRAPHQVLHAGNQPIGVERAGIERLSPREGKQAVGERGGPIGGVERGSQETVGFGGPA